MEGCDKARVWRACEDSVEGDIDVENAAVVAQDPGEDAMNVDAAATEVDTFNQRERWPLNDGGRTGGVLCAEEDHDMEEDDVFAVFLVFVVVGAVFATMDWRSLRAPSGEQITVRSEFYPKLKAQRLPNAYRKRLRCSPESFDALCVYLEPLYYKKYGLPGKNAQYKFDFGFAVLLTYYGNGCGQDGDGIGGGAAQLGMSRPVASRYIKKLEVLLYEMMDDVIYFSLVKRERRME
ncbi:hypothetical protein ON010_g7077 [Phytophthora cinnamomi]|nr:hypothetical protein ON010_g7077 [Phytophthora cinnamomi]